MRLDAYEFKLENLMAARLGNALLALSLVLLFSIGTVTPAKGTGATGPIQIGGDDANDHGGVVTEDADSDPETAETPVLPPATALGWRYVMLSLKEILATESRSGASNSIAVIGTDGSSAYVTGKSYVENDGGVSCANATSHDSYCMMEVIKAELNRLNGAADAPEITYYKTAAQVSAFFNALTAGTVNVAVVFIPGDGGCNDLGDFTGNETCGDHEALTDDDEVDGDPAHITLMEQALMDSASDIAAFNARGGGLLASGHDNYLSWLKVCIPTIEISIDPTSNLIGMTADGANLWTGLHDSDIYAPWHNHFTGDLGGLRVLGLGFGFNSWTDTNTNLMIDSGEATVLNWNGPDGLGATADDAQTIIIIGGARGEAALEPGLPPTNTSGDAAASWALLVAALAAVAGLALRVVERKRLQA